MNYAHIINAITSQIMNLGGTHVYPDGNFRFGSLTLFDIRYGELVFCEDRDSFLNAKGVLRFPLSGFSESFLMSLLTYYRNLCHEQLTPNASEEIVRAVEKYRTAPRSSRWDFVDDEEHYGPDGSVSFTGILSDGEHFLFFRTDGGMDEGCTCFIHNSILMDEDSIECYYPWTAENDSRLLECLNSLEDPQDYCGEGSPIRTLSFEPVCPYCGCEEVEPREGEAGQRLHHCPYCDRIFNDEDIEYESLRHRISALLNGTSEEEPLECDITIGEDEACGLSSLEMPNVIKAFEVEGDGTILVHIEGDRDIQTGELHWTDINDLTLSDLKAIYKELSSL